MFSIIFPKIKPHLVCSVPFSRKLNHTLYVQYHFPENHAVCEIVRKNAVKPERLYMKTHYGACSFHGGYLRFRHTLIIRDTSCSSAAAVVTRTHLNVTFIRTLLVLFCFHPLHGRQRSRHGSDGKIEIVSGNIIIIIIIIITIIITKYLKQKRLSNNLATNVI
jgi:hypothetical protein